jgi:hypothetical protein
VSPKNRQEKQYLSQTKDFKLTLIKRDIEGHSTLIKGEMHQEEITITNLYAPNVSVPSFIKHTLKDLKAYIESNTVVLGDFNIPHIQQIIHANKKPIKKF